MYSISSQTENITCSNSRSSLVIFYQNCRGLNSKIKDFSLSIISADYDVVALTEAWLKSSTLSTELFGNNYFVYRCDRFSSNSEKSAGGGVLVAVKSNFQSEHLFSDSFANLEIVVIRMVSVNVNIYICCLYIPPNLNCNIYDSVLNALNEIFKNIISLGVNDNFFFLGDFNITACNWVALDNLSNVYIYLQ